MKIFEHNETHLNMEKWNAEHIAEHIQVAEWAVVACNNAIIIQKITPNTKSGDVIKKVIKVEKCDDYIVKVLKTKIKAIGGAEGLVDWMIKDHDLFQCRIEKILNYAWDEMKYCYL